MKQHLYLRHSTEQCMSDTVLIEDINGCQLLYIQDHECKCTNDIGVIPMCPLKKCADASITIIYDN
ncbi:MAG: hypothetical protein U0T81_01180 [Saprospiraceae bacterium]